MVSGCTDAVEAILFFLTIFTRDYKSKNYSIIDTCFSLVFLFKLGEYKKIQSRKNITYVYLLEGAWRSLKGGLLVHGTHLSISVGGCVMA